jgi:hypothetical protein
MEAMQATVAKTDLPYEAQISIRKAGASKFEATQQPVQLLYYPLNPRDRINARGDFDVRIVWKIPDDHPRRQSGYSGP